MKKWLCIIMLCVFALAMCACSKFTDVEDIEKWDCTVMCAEKSDADSYVITYSDEEIISSSGVLSFQNRNEFDIVVHLLTNGKEEQTLEIRAGGIAILYQVEKETVYTVGCYADVEEGTEIKLMVYDGEDAETY